MMQWTSSTMVLAQAEGDRPAPVAGGGFGFLIPMVLILVVFFWMTHRSQKKKDQQRQQMLDNIQAKDKVVTIGGIHGRVVHIKEDAFVLCVNEEKDVRLTISRSGISRKEDGEEAE